MLKQDVRHFKAYFIKIGADAKEPKRGNTEFASKVCKKEELATTKLAWVMVSSQGSTRFKSRLVASRVKRAKICWKAFSVAKNVSKV